LWSKDQSNSDCEATAAGLAKLSVRIKPRTATDTAMIAVKAKVAIGQPFPEWSLTLSLINGVSNLAGYAISPETQ